MDLLGDAEIDDDLCDRIFDAMHTRLSDKLPTVRVHAIRALSRLQDPSDKHCPIIKCEIFKQHACNKWLSLGPDIRFARIFIGGVFPLMHVSVVIISFEHVSWALKDTVS